jgi:hypothetical protein
MVERVTGLIENLKKGALERCRERVLSAEQNPDKKIRIPEPHRHNHGMTTRLRQFHGLG